MASPTTREPPVGCLARRNSSPPGLPPRPICRRPSDTGAPTAGAGATPTSTTSDGPTGMPRKRSVTFGSPGGALEVVQMYDAKRPVQEVTYAGNCTSGFIQSGVILPVPSTKDGLLTGPGVLRIELVRLSIPTDLRKPGVTCAVQFRLGKQSRRSARRKSVVTSGEAGMTECVYDEWVELDVDDATTDVLRIRLREKSILLKKGPLGPNVLIPLAPLRYWKPTPQLFVHAGACRLVLSLHLLPPGQGSGPLGVAHRPESFMRRTLSHRRSSLPTSTSSAGSTGVASTDGESDDSERLGSAHILPGRSTPSGLPTHAAVSSAISAVPTRSPSGVLVRNSMGNGRPHSPPPQLRRTSSLDSGIADEDEDPDDDDDANRPPIYYSIPDSV